MGDFSVTYRDQSGIRYLTLKAAGASSRYEKLSQIVIEEFPEGVLLFHAGTLKIFSLNTVSARIYKHLADGLSLLEVSKFLHDEFDEDKEVILQDVMKLAETWESNKLLKRIICLEEIEGKDMEKRYVIDKSINCREEAPEGAILYHVERDVFQVINPTGLVIWNLVSLGMSISGIAEEMVREFDEIPIEELLKDIEEFIQSLVKVDFIREVTES